MMNSNKPDNTDIRSGEIWLLIDSLRFGGIETHVRELATGLQRFGQRIRVVIIRRYPQPQLLPDILTQQGLPCSYLSDIAPASNVMVQIYHAVRQYHPSLLHAHGYKASLCARLTRLLTGIPQFSTFHAGETPTGRVWFYDWLDRYTNLLSSQTLCVSKAIADKLPGKPIVMNNFIAKPEPAEKQGEQIAFIGRLSQEKAPDRFLRLARQFPGLNFHLYGDGPMHQEIREQAPDNLTMHGHLSDMQPYWENIGLLIIPSRFEGLPMVSLEAMGRGIPVIATEVGALPSLIQHGINGWIAKSEADLTGLLSQWGTLSEHQKTQAGQQARETVCQHYTEEAVLPELIALYQQHITG